MTPDEQNAWVSSVVDVLRPDLKRE